MPLLTKLKNGSPKNKKAKRLTAGFAVMFAKSLGRLLFLGKPKQRYWSEAPVTKILLNIPYFIGIWYCVNKKIDKNENRKGWELTYPTYTTHTPAHKAR